MKNLKKTRRNTNVKTAWEMWQELGQEFGASRRSEELYAWFVAESGTIGYTQEGAFTLFTKPEAEAIAIMEHIAHRLREESNVTWREFLDKRKE